MADQQPQQITNPYLNKDNPKEPSLCGFGASFLSVLSGMVSQYQIMPQDLIDAITPPPDERAAILRARAADLMQAAQDIENANTVDDEKPKWGSKWKH